MTNPCECPKCGGLPHNPRMMCTGDIELVRGNIAANRGLEHETAADVDGTDIFTFSGNGAADWRLDALLLASNPDGTRDRACSDCGHHWAQ